MVHWHYIGYFDPEKPLDLPHRPALPLPGKPVSAEMLEQLAQKFGVVLGKDVILQGGYALSHLGMFEELHPLETELVAQGCIVLTEMGFVVQPPEAARMWQKAMVESDWGNKTAEPGAAADRPREDGSPSHNVKPA